jgi:hypothetical protein
MIEKKQIKYTRKVNHSREEWSYRIKHAQAGDKESIDWIYSNVIRIFRRLRRDEDDVQELLIHFHRKVLPKLNPDWMPIPIIYKAAKRILINLHKKNSSVSDRETRVYENSEQKPIVEIDNLKYDFDSINKLPELIKVALSCHMSFQILRLINEEITHPMLTKLVNSHINGEYADDRQKSLFDI